MMVLASASPRRAELLRRLGVPFRTVPAAIDEAPRPGEAAPAYVLRLACEKAVAAGAAAPTLGADTALAIDGRILGKPRDEEEGVAMLHTLSGREHEVFTGLFMRDGNREACRLASAVVTFREIDAGEARAYWRTGEGRDKAGGYGIQGIGGVFASRIDGSFGAVVGLPLRETDDLLRSFNVPCWRNGEVGAR